jgi:hypothetical protein
MWHKLSLNKHLVSANSLGNPYNSAHGSGPATSKPMQTGKKSFGTRFAEDRFKRDHAGQCLGITDWRVCDS